MIIKNFESDFTNLTPKYIANTGGDIVSSTFYSDEAINLTVSPILSAVNDVKTNNFSTLLLTDRTNIGNTFKLTPLTNIEDRFSTFLAFNAFKEITSDTYFWSANENTTIGNNSAALNVEKVQILANRHFFDITFLDGLRCKISHEHNGLIRFLTLDYIGNLSLSVDQGLGFLGEGDPQTFYYFYDQINDWFLLYRQVLDIPYYISYNTFTNNLELIQPPTGPSFPFSVDGIIRLRPHTGPSDTVALTDYSAHYKQNTLDNTLDISETLSLSSTSNNYLVHYQLGSVSGAELPVNLISLKNELTPNNNNTTYNPFFTSDLFDTRNYDKLITGTQQVHGLNNVEFSYSGFTAKLIFQPDAVTYFHTPNDMFPYQVLSINDANITYQGAIAGDHPLKADKVFKKLANYRDYTPFGSPSSDTTGQFLCTWLSGSPIPNTPSVWIDRYFNLTGNIESSSGTALTTEDGFILVTESGDILNTEGSGVIPFVTTLNQILSGVNILVEYFDKISDLTFEPGCYYAYHHIGNQDLKDYLHIFDKVLVQDGFSVYYDDSTLISISGVNEFLFDGRQYAVVPQLSATQQFTISFDLLVSDWNNIFGNQIVGNFIDKGVGIFVENYITPFLYYTSQNNLFIYNTAGILIKALNFEANISSVIRQENLKNYFIVLQSGLVYELQSNNTTVYAVNLVSKYNLPISNVINTFYTSQSAVTLFQTVCGAEIGGVNLDTRRVTNITNITTLCATPFTAINSVYIDNNQVYGLTTTKSCLNNGLVYYLNSETEIRVWSLSTNSDLPFLQASIPILDFNIDKFQQFWVATDNKINVFSLDRQVVNTFQVNTDGYNVEISFVNEILPLGEVYYTLLTLQDYSATGDGTLSIIKINLEGQIIGSFNTKSLYPYKLINQNITNDDFSRREIINTYQAKSLNAKISLIGQNNETEQEVNLFYPLSALDSGYHTLTLRYDGIQGVSDFFIDGLNVDRVFFNSAEYIFNNILNVPITIGAPAFYDASTLPLFLRQKAYYMLDSTISNFKIYESALNDFDILALAGSSVQKKPILLNFPSGSRHYVDEIERTFKLDVPQRKANKFNLRIKGLNISDTLKQMLTNNILDRLAGVLPANSQVNTVKWENNP